MIDDFDGDAAGLRFVEGAGDGAVEGGPGVGVDFSLKGGFKRGIGVARAEEVGVTDEEGFLVVVGVDEPARDAFGAVGADFSRAGVENVDALDFDDELAFRGRGKVDVGLAEDDEEVALAVVP